MPWVGRWWRQYDRFNWLSAYIQHRQMRRFTQVTVALIKAGCAAMIAAMVLSPSGPRGIAAQVLQIAVALCFVGLAVMWLRRWPSRTLALLDCAIADLCIAITCLLQRDPRVGVLFATGFAVLGGYIALFHTAKWMIANFTAATAVAVVLSERLAVQGDPVLAVCAVGLIVTLNAGIPITLQGLVYAMGIDITRADRDSLTGLLNRRAFYRAAEHLLLSTTDTGYFAVVMIDLDNFKQLNDARGHPAGDRALVDVSDVLKTQSQPSTVIARAGGEEFLLAYSSTTPAPADLPGRLCRAIAALPAGVTASIGTASIAVTAHAVAAQAAETIDELIAAADAAMYEVKRDGGDQVNHRPVVNQKQTL